MVPDSEEEEEEIAAAIEASRRTARFEAQQRLNAGPSSSRTPTTSHVIRKGRIRIVESDEERYEDSAESDDKSDLSVLESSDVEPLSKRKGKAQAKPKKGKANISTEPLTWVERAKRRRLARRERYEAKRDERLLAEKLGRNLTWVCPRSAHQMAVCSMYIPVGEGLPGNAEASSRTHGCVG